MSLSLSGFFVFRDAKKFALNPPTPLIDLDRMYDVIFERLDEETGGSITPDELSEILNGFVVALDKNDLVSEDLLQSQIKKLETTLDNKTILEAIKKNSDRLDVPDNAVLKVIDLAFTYLGEINAVT